RRRKDSRKRSRQRTASSFAAGECLTHFPDREPDDRPSESLVHLSQRSQSADDCQGVANRRRTQPESSRACSEATTPSSPYLWRPPRDFARTKASWQRRVGDRSLASPMDGVVEPAIGRGPRIRAARRCTPGETRRFLVPRVAGNRRPFLSEL